MLARISQWAGYDKGFEPNALDVGRGIAILAVIYGHALAPWFMGAGGSFSEGAFLQWKFGAAFIMVLFFFLSGASWREHRSLDTTFRQAIALVLIAWTSSVALDLLLLAISASGLAPWIAQPPLSLYDLARNAARSALYGYDYSMSALWFLTALAAVRVVAAVTVRMGRPALWGAAALLLMATLTATELGWRNFYQLNLIGVAFFAFVAGHAMRSGIADLERWPPAAFALAIFAAAAAAATFHLNEGCRWDWAAQCGQGWLNDRFGVSMIIGQFGNWPLFAFTAMAGVAFGVALSILLVKFGGIVGDKLAQWGRASLNLLIVNCLFLELGNPIVAQWLAPHAAADHALFFIVVFALSLALNLIAAAGLKRPLRALQGLASWGGARAVDLARRAGAIVVGRGLRVSRGHD